MLRKISFGLRFLKQNLPSIEILEYPTWEEYVKKLKEGWDVVGFSFFTNEIPEVLKMVEEARKRGVQEVWAGNYGALTPGIEGYFDKIFIGYAENEVRKTLGENPKEIEHPPLIVILRLGPINFKYKPFGVLFTQRGCPIGCNFCQTPIFCPRPFKISLNSIENVLKEYKKRGIEEVVILDENFGILPKHTEYIVELLGKYGVLWSVMTRADYILKNFNYWIENGFISGFIGIENLSPLILEKIGKKEEIEKIKECVKKMHEKNRYIIGYYIIGFENETEQEIREKLIRVSSFHIDFNQLCILTPLPRTPLWYEIDRKYGIFDRDWHHWDTKHLVWNHPYVSPSKMRQLLLWGFKILNPALRYYEGIARLTRTYLHIKGWGAGWRYLLWDAPYHAFKIRKYEKSFIFTKPF